MAEPFGQVTVDDVETKDIGLHDLRKNISIIPQVCIIMYVCMCMHMIL